MAYCRKLLLGRLWPCVQAYSGSVAFVVLLCLTFFDSRVQAAEQVLSVVPRVGLPLVKVPLDAAERGLIQARRVLRLGVSSDYEPLEVMAGHVLKGITVDYLSMVGASLQLPLEVRVYPDWAAALAGLRAGEVDVLGRGSSYEAGLSGLLLSQPYVANESVLVARRSNLTVKSGQVSGALALVDGYVALDQVLAQFPDSKPKLYASTREALHSLQYRHIDWFVGDAVTSAYQLAQGELPDLNMQFVGGLNDYGYSFVFRAADAKLCGMFNRVMANIPQLSRSEILSYWGVRARIGFAQDDVFTKEERSWLADAPLVRVGVSGSVPPFSFFDEKDDFRGIFADLMEVIGQRTGLRFQFVKQSSLSDLLGSLRQSRADMSLLQASPEREDFLSFTQPVINSSYSLVGPVTSRVESLAQLGGKRLALLKDSRGIAAIIGARYPQIRLVERDTQLDALVAVTEGEADAAVLLLPVAHNLIDMYFAKDLRVLDSLPQLQMSLSFAVNKKERLLYSVLEKSVERLEPWQVGAIVERWQEHPPAQESIWGRYISLLRWISLALGSILFLMLIWLVYAYFRRSRLRSETERLAFRSALLDGIPHAIAVRDRQGRFVLCNQAFYSGLGLQVEQVIGLRPSDISGLDHEQAQVQEEDYLALLAKGEACRRQVELSVQGRPLKLREWMVPYPGKDGQVGGMVMGWVDMTETELLLQQLHEARDQALQASEAKSRFLAVMSHEIRTPLNAVIGLLELCMLRVDQGEDWDRQAIEVAYASSSSLLLLIGDILDLAKIESGKLTLDPKPCKPREVLDSVIRVFEGLARQKGLYLRANVQLDSESEVLLDAGRLKQVLSNLLSNALKFTDQGGVQVLLCGREGAAELQLEIDVSDSGVGISAADQALLFEPFSQARGLASRGGSGLGLVICRQLVDMMGGNLHLESSLGKGTHVHIELSTPLVASPRLVAVVPQTQAASAALRILLVDDHPANSLLLGQQLRFLGHEVSEAEDGRQAFTLIQRRFFDVVITDCNMPVMDGYELTRRVRAWELAGARTARKIIGYTANAQPEERQRCLDVGMDDCLFKPVSLEALRQCLSMCAPSLGECQELGAATSKAQCSVFDLGLIDSLTGGDQKLIGMLFTQLHDSNAQDLRQLDEALAAGRWREQGQLVHRLKGAARMVGAQLLVEAALAYEEGVADAMDDAELQCLANRVRTAMQQLQEAIDGWLSSTN